MDDDGAFVGGHDAYLEEIAGVVGANEHDQAFVEVFGADGVVERVKDGGIAHAMLAGAGRDDRLHVHKLACR